MNDEFGTRNGVRKILLIAYYFPPLGGAGVQRTLKYTKYLPQFGWQPVVLTSQAKAAALSDPTLMEDLAGAQAVYRTRVAALPPALPWRLRNLVTRWLLVTDDQAGWYPFALREALRLIKQERVDAIYTTSTPYTAHLVGLRLKQRLGLPWVADFRDPWAGNTSLRPPTGWHRRRIERWEQQVVSAANRVTVVSEPMARDLCAAFPELGPEHFLALPNGFDPDDFTQAAPQGADPNRMTVVYSGSFYGQRTSLPFLQALHGALADGQIPRQAIRVRFVGNVGQATAEQVQALGLSGVAELTGYVPHRESIGYVLGADVLLLVVAPGPGSQAVLTGKLFEYLAAGKPILALVPPSAAADLVRESRAGVVVDPENVPSIREQLLAIFQQWQQGTLASHSDPAVVARYDRRRLTGLLAAAFTEAEAKS